MQTLNQLLKWSSCAEFTMLQENISETKFTLHLKKIYVLHQKTNLLGKLNNRNKTPVLVHNFSSKILTAEQMQLLQKDTKCNTNEANPVDFIATIETIIYQIKVNV